MTYEQMYGEFSAGYLIVRTYAWLFEWYCNCGLFDHAINLGIYALPQKGLRPESYDKRYSGLDRIPLTLELSGLYPKIHERAALVALEQLERRGGAKNDFIFSVDDARYVFSKLQRRTHWDMIWAARTDRESTGPRAGTLLGYEPTYFGGDHFSAVADCLCFPRWHGCDPEGTLFKEHFDRLNQHALFDSAEEAQDFLKYYSSFDQAEIGEYCIAQIMEIEPLTST